MIDFKLVKRDIKFFWQRLIRGWDDSETWSMDHTFADFMLPRLKRFKEVKISHPHQLTPEEWDHILESIIEAFAFYASDRRFDGNQEDFDNAQVGLDLFAKWFKNLWW